MSMRDFAVSGSHLRHVAPRQQGVPRRRAELLAQVAQPLTPALARSVERSDFNNSNRS